MNSVYIAPVGFSDVVSSKVSLSEWEARRERQLEHILEENMKDKKGGDYLCNKFA